MRYYLFNIGGPYTDEWWARHVSMGIISAGFDNAVGDRGDTILHDLQAGDWVIAYANRPGAVGAGMVGGEDTYRLARRSELPSGFESSNRHLRSVQWVHHVESLVDAVPFAQLRLPNRRTQTRTKLTDANACRIIRLLASKTVQKWDGLADEEADRVGSSYRLKDGDRRQVVERQIRERRGQQQFRDHLCTRYGNRCVVTGCKVLAVLEAAHIKPYRVEEDNHPANGLLLRADIHTLFDLDLLGIDPERLRVALHPDLGKHTEYRNLAGKTLLCTPDQQPSSEALRLRHEQFQLSLHRRA